MTLEAHRTRFPLRLTRKEALKLGALGSAALLLPVQRAARTQLTIKDRLPESRLPLPFRVPLSVPPLAKPLRRDNRRRVDYYSMTMKAARVQILPDGPKTYIFGYNGLTPGPTIRERRGRKCVVRQINRLPKTHPYLGYECTTSVHLHGSDSLPQYDGWAEDVTRPGQYKDYRYPDDQDARPLWYHDHAIHHTAQNAYMGCAALYTTHDELEASLPVPKGYGRYEIPLILQDKIFAQNGNFIYDDAGESNLYGDVILVNGRPWPGMKVERRKYRLRFLNASVSRGFHLALDSGEPFTVVGHDGGFAPEPTEVTSFRLGMAERYGVIVDFARHKIGDQVILRNLSLPNNQDFANTDVVMRFDVASNATNTADNSIPDRLNPSTGRYNPMRLQESDAARTRRWVFERKNGLWTINGRTWNSQRSDANVPHDGVEIWELENRSGGWFHPVHIHLIDFKILDRNGAPPHAYERGPKDVAYIGENETVRVIARFGPTRGKYMMHCHNLIHEDHDMMTHFDVGATGRDPARIDPARPLPAPPL